ncbi:hypothetical protein P171DRAFT_428278 [Karstenula rhodostoma CBS 690.94]|uniref:Uncharacterized protein n=1 Tax=Karstenula rhodostoma CBS 690.94 TaxID=1392251 RepID=A0A9P4PQ88_9PLEO|nr:hypothetical protein P171DRAFT_428278 [Karstenula rhodostoma CBS 690.94]
MSRISTKKFGRTKSPIEHPITSDWDLALTHEDYNKLLEGFRPRDMDNKWSCVTDTPDAKGNTVVHVSRSGPGPTYMHIAVEAGNPHETEGDNWGKITSITWNPKSLGYLGEQVTEEEAKQEAINFSRGLMGCKMSNAPTLYVYEY